MRAKGISPILSSAQLNIKSVFVFSKTFKSFISPTGNNLVLTPALFNISEISLAVETVSSSVTGASGMAPRWLKHYGQRERSWAKDISCYWFYNMFISFETFIR